MHSSRPEVIDSAGADGLSRLLMSANATEATGEAAAAVVVTDPEAVSGNGAATEAVVATDSGAAFGTMMEASIITENRLLRPPTTCVGAFGAMVAIAVVLLSVAEPSCRPRCRRRNRRSFTHAGVVDSAVMIGPG